MIRRQTIQCSIVLEAVTKTMGHATADEIYEMIHKDYPSLSRATVYRNLNRLADEGLIRKILLPGGADCFERMCSPHYHVKCRSCGRVFDVDMPYMEDLASRIRDDHGFEILSHDIIFSGICPECRASSSPDPGKENVK
ncbi:MAG: Fur family transcriptional regulator [Bullifex sp.]